MVFKPENKKNSMAGSKSIKGQKLFFIGVIVLSSALLLTVIAIGLIDLFNQGPTAHATASPPQKTHQDQGFHYPDPSDQSRLPDSVKVTGDGETVLLSASVTEGRQIYECQASTTDPSGYAWKNLAPFALLKASDGTNVIHSTDPTWLYTLDGSEVKGHVGHYTQADGTIIPSTAIPDATAIPWLRLDVTEHQGPTTGLFSNVDQIQRLYTTGGKAPKDVCNSNVATYHVIRSIEYTAEYVFWGKRP